MAKEIPKTYNPAEWEKKLYARWEKSGFFNPDNLPETHREPYAVIVPPPNANGRLHVGHSLDMTLKDIVIRFKRMRGKKTLLLPGADHAGFETQMVFEKKLATEGKTRFGMKDEELYQQIHEFTMENKKFMENDIRRLGVSCDWSRNTFTLDERVVKTVQDTFVRMYEEGFVYRGKRIVNWNPKFQTSLSDIETEFVEQVDPFYYLQYGPFVIGTVRPETKFGDKYVVMHPEDERYKKYRHGKKIELEWINGPVTATVIKDIAVDREFGSGVMTITPWHDSIDFEIAERHNLEKEQIIDFDGKLLSIAGEFSGMQAKEARQKIVEKLKAKGLLVKVEEDYKHNVRLCERTKVAIEPQIKEQWFVKMKPLAEKVIQAVEKENQIQFLPEYQKRILLHWMHNTIDWNISRQIVWGISIPAWFKDGEVCVGAENPGSGWIKDADTFDTWFSSGQWPLVTLGYPDSLDFKTYYPTELMECGTDLVFKWVPRMILFGLYLDGRIPFKSLYFHGMVNDAANKKMSKSKGNVISPVEMGDKYGIDALRLALIMGNTPGSSTALSEQKIEGQKHFANKLWNIARYVLAQSEEQSFDRSNIKSEADSWITLQLKATRDTVTELLEKHNFSLALETLQDFIWNKFADKYIEFHKIEKNNVILQHVFETTLRLAHPFMPFVTEAIFQSSHPKSGKLLMMEFWPEEENVDSMQMMKAYEFQDFQHLIDFISEIRNVRSLYRIEPNNYFILSVPERIGEKLEENLPLLKGLARVEKIAMYSETPPKNSAFVQCGRFQGYILLEGLINVEKEKARLSEEKKNLENYRESIAARLADKTFTAKAPQNVIEQNQVSLTETEQKIAEICKALTSLT